MLRSDKAGEHRARGKSKRSVDPAMLRSHKAGEQRTKNKEQGTKNKEQRTKRHGIIRSKKLQPSDKVLGNRMNNAP